MVSANTSAVTVILTILIGEVRQVTVDDVKAAVANTSRPKADPGDSSQVGAPMSGVVVEIRVKDGGEVKKGDPIAVLSAMKMVSNMLYKHRRR
jgi:pyruvate carboxylase